MVLRYNALPLDFVLFHTSRTLKDGGKADQYFVILENIKTFNSDSNYFRIFIWKNNPNQKAVWGLSTISPTYHFFFNFSQSLCILNYNAGPEIFKKFSSSLFSMILLAMLNSID